MIKKNQKRRLWVIDILLLLLLLISFLGYSIYSVINEYTPSKEKLEENKKIIQNDIKSHDESSKEFDEIIKKLEEKKKHPKQLEVEKQAQIAAEKEKTKVIQNNQIPQKKEQKMTRYEDWIDEPTEVLPVENLELEKIQGPQQDER